MRVAHYYPWVYVKSGVERVILEICKRSKHKHTIYTNHYDHNNTFPELRNADIIELKRVPVKRDIGSVLKSSLIIIHQKIKLSSFNVLVVHCEGLGSLILVRNSSIPTINICYTPLRPVYDYNYRQRVLDNYHGTKRLLFLAFSKAFRFVDKKIWSNYRYILFISKESERRAKEGGLINALNKKYEVLNPGIDWFKHEPNWHFKPYFFLPGRIMWTKNIELAINAFVHFKKVFSGYDKFRLVIAGHVDEKSKPYMERLMRMSKSRADIKFIVAPSDITLWKLYANCSSVVFPAFNEDWGLVPLEANIYGKPVIAIDKGGPQESQIDGKTAILVPPNMGALCNAMKTLASNKELAKNMGAAGRDNARKYDWSFYINRFDAILDKICVSGFIN